MAGSQQVHTLVHRIIDSNHGALLSNGISAGACPRMDCRTVSLCSSTYLLAGTHARHLCVSFLCVICVIYLNCLKCIVEQCTGVMESSNVGKWFSFSLPPPPWLRLTYEVSRDSLVHLDGVNALLVKYCK